MLESFATILDSPGPRPKRGTPLHGHAQVPSVAIHKHYAATIKAMPNSVREATTQDMPALVDLLRESDAFHYAALPETFREPHPPLRAEDYVSKLLADENGVILVAKRSGAIVGLVQAAFHPSRSDPVRKDRPTPSSATSSSRIRRAARASAAN